MGGCRLFHDDCLNVLKSCRGVKFDLVYLDPPFGTGSSQKLRGLSYSDHTRGKEYLSFLMGRLKKISSVLSVDGTLLVHLDKHHIYEVKHELDHLGLHFKGDIIWSYRRWASKVNALQNNHDTILVYSKNKNMPKERIFISHSIVAPSSNERVGYPTQKPKGLIKKIISHLEQYQKIDSVLDPFMGSGTTLVVALEMGKQVCGFDISKEAVKIVRNRVERSPRVIGSW